MSELSDSGFYTETINILRPFTTADDAGGQEPDYDTIHEDLPCRAEEHDAFGGPPDEIGGAPTLIHVHKIYLDDPGAPAIVSGDFVELDGEMLRIVSGPDKRRAIDDMEGFLVLMCREVTG
jgi:hypothetical protein